MQVKITSSNVFWRCKRKSKYCQCHDRFKYQFSTTALADILEELSTTQRTHQITTSSQSSSYRPFLQTGPTTDDSHTTITEGGVTNTIKEDSQSLPSSSLDEPVNDENTNYEDIYDNILQYERYDIKDNGNQF